MPRDKEEKTTAFFMIFERRHEGRMPELYTFVRTTLPAENYNRQWHVALVTSPDDNSYDFLETLSAKVGYHVMVFKSFEKAHDWLKKH